MIFLKASAFRYLSYRYGSHASKKQCVTSVATCIASSTDTLDTSVATDLSKTQSTLFHHPVTTATIRNPSTHRKTHPKTPPLDPITFISTFNDLSSSLPEFFVDIPPFDGIDKKGWKISSMGRLMNSRGAITCGTVKPDGYCSVCINRKPYSIHRLVAEVFLAFSKLKLAYQMQAYLSSETTVQQLIADAEAPLAPEEAYERQWFSIHRCTQGCKFQVDHINGNRGDNRIQNLQWLTTKQHRQKTAFVRLLKAPHKPNASARTTLLTHRHSDTRILFSKVRDVLLFLNLPPHLIYRNNSGLLYRLKDWKLQRFVDRALPGERFRKLIPILSTEDDTIAQRVAMNQKLKVRITEPPMQLAKDIPPAIDTKRSAIFVSNMGRIRFRNGRITCGGATFAGYRKVFLGGKTYSVHRLIAMGWLSKHIHSMWVRSAAANMRPKKSLLQKKNKRTVQPNHSCLCPLQPLDKEDVSTEPIYQIDHIDGQKHHNAVDNLQWLSPKEHAIKEGKIRKLRNCEKKKQQSASAL